MQNYFSTFLASHCMKQLTRGSIFAKSVVTCVIFIETVWVGLSLGWVFAWVLRSLCTIVTGSIFAESIVTCVIDSTDFIKMVWVGLGFCMSFAITRYDCHRVDIRGKCRHLCDWLNRFHQNALGWVFARVCDHPIRSSEGRYWQKVSLLVWVTQPFSSKRFGLGFRWVGFLHEFAITRYDCQRVDIRRKCRYLCDWLYRFHQNGLGWVGFLHELRNHSERTRGLIFAKSVFTCVTDAIVFIKTV